MADVVMAVGLGALAGVAIGAAFFAGLWLTVRGVAEQGRPRSLLLVSFAVRAAVAVGVLALLARQGPLPLLGALGGFLLARVLVTRLVSGRAERSLASVPTGQPADAGGKPVNGAAADDRGTS